MDLSQFFRIADSKDRLLATNRAYVIYGARFNVGIVIYGTVESTLRFNKGL